MGIEALGSGLTDTQTAADGVKNVLGEVYWFQGKGYRYVKNGGGSALTVNRVVVFDLTDDNGTTVVASAAALDKHVAGVAISAIPALGFGWIQVHGLAAIDFDGGGTDTVAGSPVVTSTTLGKVAGCDVTVASQVASSFGFAYDALTTDVTAEIFLRGLV